MARMNENRLLAILLVLCLACYAVTYQQIWQRPRDRQKQWMQISLPPVPQLMLAFGDRYLAANMATFRAVTVGVETLPDAVYQKLGEVQVTAARLNPKQEDNYYTAAAILPWNGQYEAGQSVLAMATRGRQQDALPPFFHGFNRFYFKQDYYGAAKDLEVAAARSEPVNRRALTSIAAKWYEKGSDPVFAIQMLDGLIASNNHPDLKRLLQARRQRLVGLVELRLAAEVYRQRHGRPAGKLQELVGQGMLPALPVDPFGHGYGLDASGKPFLNKPSR